MVLGFKTGPRNWAEGQRIIEDGGARMCELWFRVDRTEDYEAMLDWLAEREVSVGLHHWGLAPGNCKTNLMTADTAVREATLAQIKETIDIGASLPDCAYVNAHPGAAQLEEIDFDHHTQTPIEGTRVPTAEARRLLLAAAEELYAYAADRDVLFTLETLPAGEQYTEGDRSAVYHPGNADLLAMEEVTHLGPIANDITHTATQLAHQTADATVVWQELLAFTQRTATQTRLVHVNTIRPPLGSTDTHDGITKEDFSKGVFPEREQLIDLLRVYHGSDVFLVPEPSGRVYENYRALQEIVSLL